MISFLLWESKGIRLFDLHLMDESINYRDVFVFYLGVAGITILYSVVLSIVGFSGVGAPVPVLVRCADTNMYVNNPFWVFFFVNYYAGK